MNKFIITGTGRCGTTYAQAILKICGVKCGHQSVFTHRTTINYMDEVGLWDWKDYEGDSSFMAVPVLSAIKKEEPDTKIILLYRDYVDVARSWIKLGLFGEDMKNKYPEFHSILSLYYPDVLHEKLPSDRALTYCRLWNEDALRHCEMAINIDFLTEFPEVLFQALGCLDKLDKVLVGSVSKKINSYGDENRYA